MMLRSVICRRHAEFSAEGSAEMTMVVETKQRGNF